MKPVKLTLIDVFAISFGAIIGYGWVVLSGLWLQAAGIIGTVTALIAGGALVCVVGLVYAEFTAAFPRAGGEVVFVYKGLGVPGAVVCSWAMLLAYVAVLSFEAVALPTVLNHFVDSSGSWTLWTIAGSQVRMVSVAISAAGALILAIFNIAGLRLAVAVQKVFAFAILGVGILLIIGAICRLCDPMDGVAMGESVLPRLLPRATFAVLGTTPLLYVGFNVVPQIAAERTGSGRSAGRVLVWSVAVAVIFYCAVAISVFVALGVPSDTTSELATARAMMVLYGGKWAGDLLVVGGVCGILSTWNAFLIGGSRLLRTMIDVGILPADRPVTGTNGSAGIHLSPQIRSVVILTVIPIIASLLGRSSLLWVMNTGSLGIMISYGLVSVSFVRLFGDRSDPHGNLFSGRPHRTGWMTVGWLGIAAASGFVVMFAPGMPAALVWPYEYIILVIWVVACSGSCLLMLRNNGLHTTRERLEDLVRGGARSTQPRSGVGGCLPNQGNASS
jgi:basic amino acid/polyamine antiporter, APA family